MKRKCREKKKIQFDEDWNLGDEQDEPEKKKRKQRKKQVQEESSQQQQQQKKKVKINTLTFTSQEVIYRPIADKNVYDLVKQIRKLDKFSILENDNEIKQSDYEQLWKEMETIIINEEDWKELNIEEIQIKKTKVTQIHIILDRARNYWTADQIKKDLKKLLLYCYFIRSNHSETIQNYIISQIWKPLKLSQFLAQFNHDKKNDLDKLFNMQLEYQIQVDKYPIIPKMENMRKYQIIEQYEPNPDTAQDEILALLKTEKKSVQCPSDCVCFDQEKFGQFSLEKGTWDSECINRQNRIECDSHQGCLNQPISQQREKVLKIDVEETICWGFDLYTRSNIYFSLPYHYEEQEKQYFISITLLKAINRQKENGYDLERSCELILHNLDFCFSNSDRKMAKAIIQAMKFNKDAFRVHTKGLGLVCINKNGIKKNELINKYLGEIYQPWRWYEKQDFIKKWMKDHHQKDVLPDFYNIMLEIHKNDPKGTNILYVDPINKGNYSSRLSHSCNPNCGTVTTIANGEYVIGMYALKDIEYGEELTFDYCSTTESKIEYIQALCLCGQEKCRIRYLELNNAKDYNVIMDKIHCFLERNACLLRACQKEIDDEEDQIYLKKYFIGVSVLTDCPQWLRNWAVEILKFIDQEKNLYFLELQKKYATYSNDFNKYLAETFAETRVQNLIITLDKIKYFLKNTNSNNPPLSILNDQEIYEIFWSNQDQEYSLIDEIVYLAEKDQALTPIINIIEAAKKQLILSKNQLLFTRMLLLCLSHQLMLLHSDSSIHKDALSLILYFIAFTYTYFKPYEYEGFTSPKFDGQELNYSVKRKTEQRTYSSQFVWGQLIGWFKQTVANPQASLSQDRRGTLSYPSISSSFEKGDKFYPFSQSLSEFLQHLLEKPSYMWPPELVGWSYKNTHRVYGTVLFENVYQKKNFLDAIINNYESNLTEKIQLMAQFESEEAQQLFQDFFADLKIQNEIPEDFKIKVSNGGSFRKRQKKIGIGEESIKNQSRSQIFHQMRVKGVPEDEIKFYESYQNIFSFANE